jgi:hypothetical protein
MINITLLKGSENDSIFEESALCLRNSLRSLGIASEIYINAINHIGFTVYFGAGLSCSQSVFREIASKGKSAIFNLEQLKSRATVVDHTYLQLLLDYPVLDYHSENVNYLRNTFKKIDCFEIPLVPCFDLVDKQSLASWGGARQTDLLFYGSLNPRRLEILQQLLKRGFSIEVFTSGIYAKNLTSAILNAKAVLHIHYHETKLFPAARLLQPMILGVPIICEESICSEASQYSGSGITFATHDDFVSACERLLRGQIVAADLERMTMQKIAQIDFNVCWEKFSAGTNLEH